MIDEKKIEEAAQGAADLYEQDLPIMSYNEDTEVDGQHHFCQEFGAEMFKDGAHWAINEFLNALWHDASEERDYNRGMLLVKLKNGLFAVIRGFDNQYIEVVRWLYIDDLLPKKGGAG